MARARPDWVGSSAEHPAGRAGVRFGARQVAQALAAAIETQTPDAIVEEVDTLVFASRFYRTAYASSYNTMAARAPRLL